MKFFQDRTNQLLILLILIGSLFHFYNLNWGAPFYFHPDERNIASSVSQLTFPTQMNPHFFAYGSLPIYLIYFFGVIKNLVTQTSPITTVSFENAIIISRIFSALFATILIPLLFILGKKVKDKTTGLLAAFLTTTSVGFIQFAHFGTFEMWLTFFTILLFFFCLQKITKKILLLISLCLGILVAIKISSFILFPILLFLFILRSIDNLRKKTVALKIKLFKTTTMLVKLIFVCIFSLLIYFLTNPFIFLDFPSFQESITYESNVVLGTLPVFYTGEFFNTIPIIFQFTHIYPFLLNPLTTILFIISFIYFVYKIIKTKNQSFLILATFYIILFFSQAFLFAKWTRYMTPTLPFIYLIIAITLSYFLKKKYQQFNKIIILTIVITNIIFALSYFITAFVRPDTRVAAYQFARRIIPSHSPIMSEVYDLGIVPFNPWFTNIALLNFYELDNHSLEISLTTLQTNLEKYEYIILPSQRILKTRIEKKEKFPLGNIFYEGLVNGKWGYKKIYESPCDLACKIAYLGNPIFGLEQTTNVFDRPTIMIFKNNNK